MNLADYQTYWDALQPAMKQKMDELRARLVTELPACVAVTEVVVDTESDEFTIGMDIRHVATTTTVLSLDYKLLDADSHGAAEGLGVALAVSGYAGLVMGGYYPGNYSPEAFTTDLDNLKYRVDSTPVERMAGYTVGSLQNPLLVNLLAEEAGLRLELPQ